ncbi:MAG TPA: zinc ribbon domain-containing protein [Vicinamibacterales bacterium]|nr:zinc ribbon domain-containing protein [Vicinamibacterales bacterium]
MTDPRGADATPPAASGRGLAPWQLFTLVSLVAAVAAVVLSPRDDPAHLVLLSFAVLAAGLAAAAFHRMVAPLVSTRGNGEAVPPAGRTRAALEREKTLVLRAIKELEFDRAMGKVSDADFHEMAGRLRARALALMRLLEEGDAVYREAIERELAARLGRSVTGETGERAATPLRSAPSAEVPAAAARHERSCPACGAPADEDARFCKQCGARLGERRGEAL